MKIIPVVPFVLIILVPILVIFQLQSLRRPHTASFPFSTSSSSSWGTLFHQYWGTSTVLNTSTTSTTHFNCTDEVRSMVARLRDAVTFQPLKDIRFASSAMQGNTWFMSSLNDTVEGDESEYLYFPSEEHQGRLLCIKGKDTHDGGNNEYALAWPDSLPHEGAKVLNGLTYISNTYYDYGNIWHGLSAMLPFVGWYEHNGTCAAPSRWVLYHWGEVRVGMGAWLRTLMEATFGEEAMKIETFQGEGEGGGITCFEKAVVFRHDAGRMARYRRMEVFDMLRCKARAYCNVTRDVSDLLLETEREPYNSVPLIGLTLLLRTGARSFKNESTVIQIFEKACGEIQGCRFSIAHSDNLTFCEQVKVMSSTDVLISPHGAQLTNMFFMDKNSSVMEFFPKGWKEVAGPGQYVYHWEANWSGMRHEGAWRDPDGDDCPPHLERLHCFFFYKNGRVGHNESYFTDWTLNVLSQVKQAKIEQRSHAQTQSTDECPCI